jgi:hypothetical protein
VENKNKLLIELEKINKWEKDQNDLWFWEKIGKIPFAILDKLTPKFIHEKIGKILDELSTYIDHGGRYLISEKEVINKLKKHLTEEEKIKIIEINDIKNIQLEVMDSVAKDLMESRKLVATIQGATTGFGGIFTLAIDIPATLALSLKVLQEMAISYGYNPSDKEERLFIIKCLQFTSSDIVGKEVIINELFNNDSNNRNQGISAIQGWREVFLSYKDNFGWKKIFQMIPVAGLIFGSYLNRKAINDIAEVGTMFYKKRRILEKIKEMEERA